MVACEWCTEHEKAHARSQMNYWKKNHCMDNVYASELAFSLIYDNIDPQKIKQALATMGLVKLPQVMLLVQVDDYLSKYSEITITREYNTKANVRNCLQDAIENSDYAGFAANLVGMDTLVCFLCLPESMPISQESGYLFDFAVCLQQQVLQQTGVSVTICISDVCQKQSDYPVCYMQGKDMLYNSFYLGKSAAVISYRAGENIRVSGTASPFLEVYPLICVTLSNGDHAKFEGILSDICMVANQERIPPGQVKNGLAGLIHTMEVYVQNCGVEHQNEVSSVTAKCAEQVLRSGYMEDAVACVVEYHRFLNEQMRKLPNRDAAQAFREPIQEYCKNHYMDEISQRELAQISGYSTYYFTRLFKKFFGCTMTEYLLRFRIERSKEFLTAGVSSVGEVAEQCGFESANYYSRCFRKHVGMTPREYRKQYDKSNDQG